MTCNIIIIATVSIVILDKLTNAGAQAVSFAAYGQGTGPILLDDVACTGTETRLIECRASPITTHNCVHAEDASVRCQAPPSISIIIVIHVICINYWYCC